MDDSVQPDRTAPRAGQVVVAFAVLMFVDVVLHTLGFTWLRRRLVASPIRPAAHTKTTIDPRRGLRTLDKAAVYYPRQTMCLQRSLALVWLLRREGCPAQLVLGCRHTPFYAHAWVEVDGVVVNDVASVKSRYPEIDRV